MLQLRFNRTCSPRKLGPDGSGAVEPSKGEWSVDQSQRTFTNRRHLLRGGAALSGAAVVAAGLPRTRRWRRMRGPSRLQKVLDRGKLVVGTGATNPPWHYEDADGNSSAWTSTWPSSSPAGFRVDGEQLRTATSGRDGRVRRRGARRRIPNLLADKIDIVCQFMTVNPLRATAGRIHDPLLP